MNAISPISFYVPGATLLHRLHIIGKLTILLFYVIMIFSIQSPVATLLFYILLVGFIMLLGLPFRNRIFVTIILFLLVLVLLTSYQQTTAGQFIVAISKVTSLFMVVAMFTMTTRLNSILQLLDPRNKNLYTFYQLVYVINTTLAVAPSIQYDLHRAVDSETIRRGKKIGFFSFESWITILIITLVRTLNRTERFTDTVIDRGFIPSQGLPALSERSVNRIDIFVTLSIITPGILIWIFTM